MTIASIAKKAEKFVVDNSPTILTVIGVTGTLTTAYFAGTASFKAADIIADEQYRLDHIYSADRHQLELKEKAELVWKLYVPAVGTGILTIAAIITANRIGSRRAAAIAAAYSISEKAIAEYKDKVIEKLGAPKEQKIRDEIAQDRINRNPAGDQVVVLGNGDVLCFDAYTGRYFNSSMEALKKAQNDLNYRVLNDYYASLSDFYNLVGLPTTAHSDDVGWNSDKIMELAFSTCLSEDGRPCISIDFNVVPIKDYYRLR